MSQQRTPANIWEDGKDTGVSTTNLAFVTQENEPGHNQGGLLSSPEAFDSGDWTTFDSATVTADQVAAPDGTQTADDLSLAASSGSRVEQQPAAVPGGTADKTFTASCYVKVASGTEQFRLKNTHGGVLDNFSSDLTATTEWQRFSFTVTNGSSAGTGQQYFAVMNESAGGAKNLLIWGAQLEEGSSPSDYLIDVVTPTEGRAATHKLKYDQSDGTWALEDVR